jgi:hypothetical protein
LLLDRPPRHLASALDRTAAASLLAEGAALATTQGSHGIAQRIAARAHDLGLSD